MCGSSSTITTFAIVRTFARSFHHNPECHGTPLHAYLRVGAVLMSNQSVFSLRWTTSMSPCVPALPIVVAIAAHLHCRKLRLAFAAATKPVYIQLWAECPIARP